MRFLSLINLQRDLIINNLKSLRFQSSLKIFVVTLATVTLLVFEFSVSTFVFRFIRDFPGVGSIILERLMFLFYFALFFMLVFSNAIVSFSSIYRSKEITFLFTMPIKEAKIFIYKWLEACFLSSWAFFVVILPVMFSFGIVNRVNWVYYPMLFVLFLPFLAIASAIGSFLTTVLVRFFPRKNLRVYLAGIFLIMIILFLFLFRKVRFSQPAPQLEVFILNQLIPNVRFSHFPFIPSYWMQEAILASASPQIKKLIFYFLLITSNALFFTNLTFLLAERTYQKNWHLLQSTLKTKVFRLKESFTERLLPLFRIFKLPFRGLMIKDIKLFLRDPVQWSQFLVFFGLLAVYFLNIRNLSYNILEDFWKNLCAFLNLTATLLTLGSLSIRFVFPQISLEGNKFWILGLAPIGYKKLLNQKFWWSLIPSLIITEALVIISNIMLGIWRPIFLVSIFTVFISNLALIGLSVGLGAVFANFKSENPAQIVSGFGGTLTLILSLAFIVSVVILIAVPFQLYLRGTISSLLELKRTVLFSLLCIGFLGLVLCIMPLWYGEKRLRTMEF